MTRKKWIIVGIIGILFIVGAILTWWLLRSKAPTISDEFSLPDGEVVDREIADPSSTDITSAFVTKDNFRRISGRPVSGFTTFSFKDTETNQTIEAIRFIDRATGSLYEVTTRDNEPRKIIASTFPKTVESVFSGPNFILNRALDDNDQVISEIVHVIENEDGTLDFEKTTLETNISSVASSGNGMFSFIVPQENGSVLVLWNGKERRSVKRVNLSLSDWNLSMLSNNDVILSTPPSGNVSGYSYRIRSANTSLVPELRKVDGLVPSFSTDGSKVLYSSFSKNGSYSFYQGSGGQPRSLPFVAHASECGWSSNRVYCPTIQGNVRPDFPDTWYTGKTSLDGDVFSFDPTVSSDAEFVFDSPLDTAFDVTSIAVNDSVTDLYFINRNDLTLWEYSLVQ